MPDVVYVAGCCTPPQTYGHSWWGTIVEVPVALAISWLIRGAAPAVAAHLPHAGPLALRDYAVLGAVHHRWWVSVASAWLGALSHVLLDHVTHASIAGTSLGLAVLAADIVPGVPWWMPIHLLATVLGALAWLAITLHIGRHGLLRRWHGPPPPVPRRPGLFWGTAIATGSAGLIAVAVLTALGRRETMVEFLGPVPRPSVVVVRAGAALGLALTVAAAVTRRRGRDHELSATKTR
jgi:hypothetical protein